MNKWKGDFLNILICPYCQGLLIKYKDWLVCRFHKLGYLVSEKGDKVDFRIKNAHLFDLDEIQNIRKG
jgi:hypothetical protein